jgi:nucleotide-binding universal stress UspA family protein
MKEDRAMLKVLVAIDGSPAAEQALAMACTLLAGKETEVTLFHVIPRHLIYGGKGGPVVAEAYDPAQEEAISRALLDGAERKAKDAGLGPTIKKEIAVGDPAELILKAAALDQTDLIIMGARGLNAAQRFLLGSVSTKVATHAPCAVLVVHAQQAVAPVRVEEGQEPAAV